MDTGRAGELGEARDARLNFGRRDHHEVGELVDDRDDVGQALGDFETIVGRERIDARKGTLGVGRRDGRIFLAGIEPDDVADIDLCELLIALLHFAEQPLERTGYFLRLRDHRD